MTSAHLAERLRVRVGQHSEAGQKAVNQDFHGACIPIGAALANKGVAVALADGISSSDVSHIASAAAVHALLVDYYCTSDAWSLRRAVQCVLAATNSWLHAQGQRGAHRFEPDRGHVCTLSALVVKARTAHLFHVGDSRIYRLAGKGLECLTQDHRSHLADGHSYLARAMGVHPQLDLDYRAIALETGDIFVLATDGVYEHVTEAFMADALQPCGTDVGVDLDLDLDAVARAIVREALRAGSDDNVTVQILRIDVLAHQAGSDLHRQRTLLRLPELPAPGATLDGYRISRELHASHRSHLYLATDVDSGATVALKIPAIALQEDPAALDRFLLEEWIARRIHSPHVLRPQERTMDKEMHDGDGEGKASGPARLRETLHVAMEYVQGQTLAQWMTDHPRPALAEVRGLVEQMARGLHAFHRMEMLHRDVRPENILIDHTGTVKIIDFGAVHVAGLAESAGRSPGSAADDILGTLQYTAPEYFLGLPGTPRSDLFSLAVITYQMLTGRLPYGTRVAQVRTRRDCARLQYRSALLQEDRQIPAWVDAVLERALHPNPTKRQEALSEFVHDLHQPSAHYLSRRRAPLAERHPLAFWRGLCMLLGVAVVVLLWMLVTRAG